MKRSISSKIVKIETIATLVQGLQKDKKIVGFCSGIFDLIEPAQIQKISECKSSCDYLIVAIRSDYGSALYETRNVLNIEADRAQVVAAIDFVDAVVLFDEETTQKVLTKIKPDILFEELINDFHSSVARFLEKQKVEPQSHAQPAPILFLDRDGTIIEHVEYVHEASKVKIIPGAIDAIKKFHDAGYRIAIVTNQPGINLGYFRKEDLFQVNKVIIDKCKHAGVVISKIYYSPSASFEVSEWRKPKPGMIEQGLKDLNGIREQSVMVGDSDIDIEAGQNAKLGRLVLISKNLKSGNGFEVCKSLADLSI